MIDNFNAGEDGHLTVYKLWHILIFGISSFRNLRPVTQLYVSVDASTKESLKKIDRPLFKDFWPRFLDSLEALGQKGQRTVYRLTLVKSWNTDEIKNYADLVSKGKPDFIEIKVCFDIDCMALLVILIN